MTLFLFINVIFNFLLEEMGERIDDLEKHVADLMTEAGIENTDEELRKYKKTIREDVFNDSSLTSRNHSNRCFNQCRFVRNVELGGEVAMLEDRLEQQAHRNLMKVKGEC
nr:PREDICTED: heat shock factor-binding protein 1-like protein 1 [Opisthocomus hoazin]